MYKPSLSTGQSKNRFDMRKEQIQKLESAVNSLRGNRTVHSFLEEIKSGTIDPGRKLHKYLCAVAELGVDAELFASPPQFLVYDDIVAGIGRAYGGFFDVANREVRMDCERTSRTLGHYRADFDREASLGPENKFLTLAFIVQNLSGEIVGQRDVVLSGDSDTGFLYLPRPAGIFVKTYIGASLGSGTSFVDAEASTAVTEKDSDGWNSSWTPAQKSNFLEILALESLDSLNTFMIEKLSEKYSLEVETDLGRKK